MRALPAVIFALALGCHDNRKPAEMKPSEPPPNEPAAARQSAPDQKAPTSGDPTPSNPATRSPAVAKLTEAVEKAASSSSAAGLRLTFRRGHDMSGIVAFTVEDDGAFELTRTPRKRHGPLAFAGKLTPAQRQALYQALAREQILGVASSTRPIGDDEQPITLRVESGADAHELTLWAKDAREHERFTRFTDVLYPLLDTLSGGEIRLRP